VLIFRVDTIAVTIVVGSDASRPDALALAHLALDRL